MARFEEGQEVPDFTLESTEGKINLYDTIDAADKGVVVYFYPRASTPGCTTEACDFRDSLSSLKSCGYSVIGISPDKMPALEKFRDNQSLNFPLASDPEKEVMEPWGAFGEKKNYGKIVQGVIRSTLVIGKDRKSSASHVQRACKGTRSTRSQGPRLRRLVLTRGYGGGEPGSQQREQPGSHRVPRATTWQGTGHLDRGDQ